MISDQTITYKKDVKTVVFHGKIIVIENQTPVFTPEQRDKRKREIEEHLYGVFKKYNIS